MQNHYDFIIIGAGLAGLSVALRMARDSYFKQKQILIIDKDDKIANDRTWCFWEKEDGFFEEVVDHQWPHILFADSDTATTIPISPYSYKKIEGADLYAYAKTELKNHSNFSWKHERVNEIIDDGQKVIVRTKHDLLTASTVFNSLLTPKLLVEQRQEQYLKQHFVGWFIRTDEALFDPTIATFMDFSIPQKGNTRFMYVLPTSTKKALFEYTYFSKDLEATAVYEKGIQDYLANLGISQYQIERKEQGNIPMTSFRFSQLNTSRILHIGTAGGWTKASTGFTFQNTQKKATALVSFLQTERDLKAFEKRSRFWWYDRWFVDVLYRHNELGSFIFSQLFKKNDTSLIFRFLDEETTLLEELKIMWSLPKKEFIKAVFSRGF